MDARQHVVDELTTMSANLDGQIDLYETYFIRSSYATVRQGRRVDATIVAIKTALYQCDTSTAKHILSEASVWSRLDHVNILPLLGFTTTFGAEISLISPWQEQGNAHDHVKDLEVDPRPLLLGIARGLDYLHSHDSGPIIHSDLKGRNVLVAEDGRALITDFGFSFPADPSIPLILRLDGGTLKWMAPELVDGEAASVQSDIWSFGMTALELFTRQEPFHGKSDLVVMGNIMKGPPSRPELESTCNRMSDAWWNICLSCWQRDPGSRPSASGVLAGTERAMSTNGPPSGCPPRSSTVDLVNNDVAQQTTCHYSNTMIQESNASHFTGVGATSNSDHRLSSMISIETPSIHHTPVDCSEVMSTPEDRAPSNRHILFDLESTKPHVVRSEPGNSDQLVQPLLDAADSEPQTIVRRLHTCGGPSFWIIFIACLGIWGWHYAGELTRKL